MINSTYYKVIFITGNARYRSCSSTFTIYWVDEILLFEKAAYLYSHTGTYKSLYIELPKHKITYLFHNFAAVGEYYRTIFRNIKQFLLCLLYV